ncbi:Electroneutral sodium bicarbonate exchanger 1, partial [Pygoscelis papua]
ELHFMKKIPTGAEASNVLVGELDFLRQPIEAFVRLTPAVLLSGVTEVPIPTRFLFVLLGPEGEAHRYHEIGRSMATIMTDEVFRDVAYKAKKRADLVAGIEEFRDQVTVLPPGAWDPSIRIEPPKNVPSQEKRKMPGALDDSAAQSKAEKHSGPELERTGRLFGGLVLDVKRKAPWFWSDFRDGLSLQCLASFLFLYCACMSPVITFGGLLGEATNGHISAMESLLGASMTGMVYSLFAGQPLTILGSTGPVLVFEKILYKFCKDGLSLLLSCHGCLSPPSLFPLSLSPRISSLSFPSGVFFSHGYLPFKRRMCRGSVVWCPVTSHLRSPLCSSMCPLFSCCCSLNINLHRQQQLQVHGGFPAARALPLCPDALFLQECQYLHGEFQGPACGRNGPYTPNVLFWCCILFFSTFVLSSLLKKFKTSRYFPTRV